MKKVILAFPSYHAMWSFTKQSKAINIHIKPTQNRMSGLFDLNEIELAITKFRAVQQNEEVKDKLPVDQS